MRLMRLMLTRAERSRAFLTVRRNERGSAFFVAHSPCARASCRRGPMQASPRPIALRSARSKRRRAITTKQTATGPTRQRASTIAGRGGTIMPTRTRRPGRMVLRGARATRRRTTAVSAGGGAVLPATTAMASSRHAWTTAARRERASLDLKRCARGTRAGAGTTSLSWMIAATWRAWRVLTFCRDTLTLTTHALQRLATTVYHHQRCHNHNHRGGPQVHPAGMGVGRRHTLGLRLRM